MTKTAFALFALSLAPTAHAQAFPFYLDVDICLGQVGNFANRGTQCTAPDMEAVGLVEAGGVMSTCIVDPGGAPGTVYDNATWPQSWSKSNNQVTMDVSSFTGLYLVGALAGGGTSGGVLVDFAGLATPVQSQQGAWDGTKAQQGVWDACVNGTGGGGPGAHLSQPFYPQASQGQWCSGDAPANYFYFGELTFDDCENNLNATGTQWFVGISSPFTAGWIGGQDATNANVTSPYDWMNEVLVPKTDLYSCVGAQIEHRTEATVYPIEQIYFDATTGRTWHYWDLNAQTASQAISFADNLGARIINPASVGMPGLARMTAPTHWCHASAEFNGGGNCNSDNICDFMVGYFE